MKKFLRPLVYIYYYLLNVLLGKKLPKIQSISFEYEFKNDSSGAALILILGFGYVSRFMLCSSQAFGIPDFVITRSLHKSHLNKGCTHPVTML